ncbi:type III secretion system effector protein kinase AopO [Aeromonas schubertii]|uniref:Type III secretion system effector protein kinase AopO n=1 Tax=Aeromonas schubertii TaxID=652 RepID=A0ABS7VC63_9GAMM|nr:type III secretion system effector protein kinase AopO [Aeromonas schubertii]MBZ6066980.1 type III secretion system effector protein kinase AopO [Aeromonas schubertii]
MKIIGTATPSITLSQAHERVANHGQHPVGELNIEGKRYRIVDNQVLRLNPHGGIARFREGVGKLFSGQAPDTSYARALTETLHAARKAAPKSPGGEAPQGIGGLFGLKPQTRLPLGWKGVPLPGAPSLEGMRVAETDKFAEGESHISIVETRDKQRLVAKIERSVAEGHLQGELEAYQHIYQSAGKHPNLGNVHGMAVVPYGSRKEEALLMDEVDGWRGSDTMRTLTDNWKQGKVSSEEYWGTVKFIAHRLLDVTGHLAKAGIVHNDIKPGNVVFDKHSGEPVVIDLGLHSRPGEQPKGFTDSFKAPELAVGSPSASEKSDVFLVVSTLLHGIEGFERDLERKPNQGLSLTRGAAHGLDERGNPVHRPGVAGVETAYTRFVDQIIGAQAELRPDSAEARLHEFLSDGAIDEGRARQILKETLSGELAASPADARRVTPRKIRELSDTLRLHLSSASTRQLNVGMALSDLAAMSAVLDKAERQEFADQGQLKSFNSLILKGYGVIARYVKGELGESKTPQGEPSPQLRGNIMKSVAEPTLKQIQGQLAQRHGLVDIATLERSHHHLETLLTVLVPSSPQEKVSPEAYDFLNRVAEVKGSLGARLDDLKGQQQRAHGELSTLMRAATAWAGDARQALQRFDSIRPVVKFGSDQDTAVHRSMIAAHAATTLQEVAGFAGEMRHFAAAATPLLTQLGRSTLADEGLTFQREQLRELATVAERLTRLSQEWIR